MKTNLIFVRHAHSTYSPDEYGRPLSERGFHDAQIVTNILKRAQIDHVIASPYKRAIQTVEGIGSSLGIEIMIEEDFKERTLTDRPIDNFEDAVAKVWEDEQFAWPGGESNQAARQRGLRATKNVLDQYRGKNVVIGTHGNMMVLIMNGFDSQYDYRFWKQLDMPDVYKLTFEESSLREVQRLWVRT
jgi:2,3-bisphosphoglycerate-dependent phosphoglycerate mutase